MKIDRLLSITLMLINRPIVTAKELSDRFDVSIRTIYRDIESIAAAGIPVTSCNGKGGGYCLRENYRVDRQLLSLDDMLSILTALKGINTTLNNSGIDDTIEKIASLVPDDKVADLHRHFENIIIDLAPWCGNGNQKQLLELINSAITENRLITFRYRNLQGRESTRQLEPMTLILKTSSWYCFGYCTDKRDYRIFRLSRMRECSILDTTFKRRGTKFSDTALLRDDVRPAVTLTLRFAPDALGLVEEYFTFAPRTIDREGYYIVTVDYPEDEWVYSSILGYGDSCEVIAPASVRNVVSTRLKNAARLYTT